MAAGAFGAIASLLGEWRSTRALRTRADDFVQTLLAEPPESDVEWLAAHGTGGDRDHARWELRYAKRTLGLISAQRDALDDRTGSVVARALSAALARDPAIATGKLRVAERQLNARLAAYAEALANREGAGSGWHLGRALLRFAGRHESGGAESVAQASAIMARYLDEASGNLRERFGSAALPEEALPRAR
jgi:hypothetical protein